MSFTYKIKEHDKPGKIAFLVYELLTDAGYTTMRFEKRVQP